MNGMQYFINDFTDFFNELSQNNHKEWFHANKSRYEKSVKQPFEKFICKQIGEIQQHDPSYQVAPKDCILRIQKDLRFTKDKTPYHLHYTALISPAGRKDKSMPGLFLRFSADGIDIMGGCYSPDKDQLQAIRSFMAAEPGLLKQLLSATDFKNYFGSIQGEVNKKIPPELKEAYQVEPLVAHKQFFFMGHQSAESITAPDLPQMMMKYWHAARPLNDYFKQAIRQTIET